MLIDEVFPAVVGARDSLRSRLAEEARVALTDQEFEELVSAIPVTLLTACCFFDKLTRLWRYEFGRPFCLSGTNELVWGTQMWVPVRTLFLVLSCVRQRLSDKERRRYLDRLANPEKHQDVLAEMAPLLRVKPSIPASFEVSGVGQANKTLDWVIGPHGNRLILLEVKRRASDLIRSMEHLGGARVALEPDHDPAILFRSVEEKFEAADPNDQLQGVWVMTDIRQESSELAQAFGALDVAKVHFAVLGDFRPDVYLLVRRESDRQFLLNLFQANEGARFTFERGTAPGEP